MRPRVADGDVAAVLTSDVRAQATRGKCDRAWPTAGVDLCNHPLLIGTKGEHFAFFFAGDIDLTVARIHAYAFGLLRYFDFSARLPRIKIHNRSTAVVFIRDAHE